MINIKFDELRWPHLFDEEIDWKESEKFQEGVKAIEQYLQQIAPQATIGHLARQFPEHQYFLMDILEHLRDNKEVDYQDYKPLPTMIHEVV